MTLPTELINQIFDELVESYRQEETKDWPSDLPRYMRFDPAQQFWSQGYRHPIKAFGNACSSFRQRAQRLIWDKVRIDDGLVEESQRLYRYLRCVDANVLSQTREFTYEAYAEAFVLGAPDIPHEWILLTDLVDLKRDDEAPNGFQLREDGSIDVAEDAPLVDVALRYEALGSVVVESDLWALLRLIFSKLINTPKFVWRSALDMNLAFHGVSLADCLAALPKLHHLSIDQVYLSGWFYAEALLKFTQLEELHLETDRWFPEEDALPFRAFLVSATHLRRLITSHSAIFADADAVVACAKLDIEAKEPSEENVEEHPISLGNAAAALRPALLELAAKRTPQRIVAAEVKALRTNSVLEPLAKWLTRDDVAQRVADTFNTSIKRSGTTD